LFSMGLKLRRNPKAYVGARMPCEKRQMPQRRKNHVKQGRN
jgi:hypothetical protein